MTGKILEKVNEKMAKKLAFKYFAGMDLRAKRVDKIAIAETHKQLILLINEKGSLCHAVHPNGTFIVMKSPKHLHNCFHQEFAINHFINTMKEVMSI